MRKITKDKLEELGGKAQKKPGPVAEKPVAEQIAEAISTNNQDIKEAVVEAVSAGLKTINIGAPSVTVEAKPQPLTKKVRVDNFDISGENDRIVGCDVTVIEREVTH